VRVGLVLARIHNKERFYIMENVNMNAPLQAEVIDVPISRA
jgi:hypothetical protein